MIGVNSALTEGYHTYLQITTVPVAVRCSCKPRGIPKQGWLLVDNTPYTYIIIISDYCLQLPTTIT